RPQGLLPLYVPPPLAQRAVLVSSTGEMALEGRECVGGVVRGWARRREMGRPWRGLVARPGRAGGVALGWPGLRILGLQKLREGQVRLRLIGVRGEPATVQPRGAITPGSTG